MKKIFPIFRLNRLRQAIAASLLFGTFAGGALLLLGAEQPEMHSVIVRGANFATVKTAVEAVGGQITHELRIINSVGANLSAEQLKALHGQVGVQQVYENHGVSTSQAVPPGCTVTTWMPNGATSMRRASLRACSAALLEQ